jgi:hypothetical protein
MGLQQVFVITRTQKIAHKKRYVFVMWCLLDINPSGL